MSPGLGVWPPPPSGMTSPPLNGGGSGDIRDFPKQNEWLLLLLLIVTLGIYTPFWMSRTAKIINRIIPERTIPLAMVWILLGVLALNILINPGVGLANTLSPASRQVFNIASFAFALSIRIYYWLVIFRFRAVLNAVLERTAQRKLSGIGTFFFGILYLQIRLNMRIKERTTQVLSMQ